MDPEALTSDNIDSHNITPTALRNARLQLNIAKGIRAERGAQRAFGNEIVYSQVSFRTSTGYLTRIDYVLTGGRVLEVKSSTIANLSLGQAHLARDVIAGRYVTPVGRNARKAGFIPGRPVRLNGFVVTVPSLFQ